MRDAISLQRIQLLHPTVRDEVKEGIEAVEKNLPAGVSIRLTQTLRTIEEQNELYAQGRTKPGQKVTNAKGGKSFHNYGLAFDYCLIKDGKVDWSVCKPLVEEFKRRGWTWGGDFKSIKDNPHFEKSFGNTVAALLGKYASGDFITGTKYVVL